MNISTENIFDVKGKKAIVTGSTRGLGYGMAEGLMEAGAEVVIVGTSDRVFTVADDFKDRGFACHAVKGNLAVRDEVYRVFRESVAALGGDLDILVTSHGIQRRHSAEEFPMEEWDEVLNVNLNSVFILCQEAGKIMLKKGVRKNCYDCFYVLFLWGADGTCLCCSQRRYCSVNKRIEQRLDWPGN